MCYIKCQCVPLVSWCLHVNCDTLGAQCHIIKLLKFSSYCIKFNYLIRLIIC